MKTQETFGPYSSSDYNGSVHLTFSTTEKLHLNSVYKCFLTASNVAGSTSLAVIVCKFTDHVQLNSRYLAMLFHAYGCIILSP